MMTNPTPTRSSGKWRRILVSAAVIVVVLGISMGAWSMWSSHRKAKLLASLKEDPRKIRDAVEQGQISRQDAREAFGEAMEARMDKTVDDYFALPAGKERDKYLDRMIDEMEARRREWQQRATTRPSTRPARERDDDDRPTTRPSREEWQRRAAERADRTAPERTAKRAEFMRAMMQRRTERGLSSGPGGGRGGWGGRGGGGGGGMRGGGDR